MFHLERMKIDDFPFAVQLANTMNWKMTVKDFEFMVKLEPQGCFVLFHGQKRLGICTSISFGRVGWFGNLVVKGDYRREGAGSLLVKHAIDYLKNKDVETIGLYAYLHLVGFYERFGFEPDIEFLVLQRKAVFLSTEGIVPNVKKQDIPKVIDFDNQCFGASRKKLLEPILLHAGNLCYVSTENDEIAGYVAAKVYDKMAEVGPLVYHSGHVEAAVMLLKNILSRLSGFDVSMCIPKKETALLNMLSKAGFRENFRVARMFLGPAVAKNCVYMAESLERG
ncbi:MAG: GNAT family N-acetyltransferase [Candidatus Bathyarchaeota archaeon]|nr:MAG: GNAT family N-acetyltransferase [Candidatus Bathyarchaeota archaeon]